MAETAVTTMAERKIILTKGNGQWNADFCGDEEVQDLFGTTCIPTPYSDVTPALVVYEAIKGRNPGYLIVVGT